MRRLLRRRQGQRVFGSAPATFTLIEPQRKLANAPSASIERKTKARTWRFC